MKKVLPKRECPYCKEDFIPTRPNKIFCTRVHKCRYRYKRRIALLRETIGKCEECGFVPEHICQLDVDHIDGDRTNRKKENLKVICANCHRLKSWKQKSWTKKYDGKARRKTALPLSYFN